MSLETTYICICSSVRNVDVDMFYLDLLVKTINIVLLLYVHNIDIDMFYPHVWTACVN